MAIRNIREIGDDVLRKKCRPVEKIDEKTIQLLDDMAETMYKAQGVGLAAPQIGICRRIFIMHLDDGIVEAINPEVTHKEGKQRVVEGCLSCPNLWGYVTRPMKCHLKAQDRHGNWFERDFTELGAQCTCHENDHLDGHVFTEIVEEFFVPEEE